MLTLFSLARGLTSLNTLHDVGDVIAKHLRRLIPSNLSVLYAYDADADELIVVHASGEHAGSVNDLRIGTGQRLSGWVAANRRTIRNSDPVLDFGEAARAMTPRLRSCLSTPLVAGSQLTGVLALYSAARDAFSEEHQRVIEVVARQVTPAVQQAAELQKTRSSVVRDKQTGLPKLESFQGSGRSPSRRGFSAPTGLLGRNRNPTDEHSADEPYLSHVVRAVRRSLRAADMLFRYRGTDLVALLLQTDRTTGDSIGQRISQAVADTKDKDALDFLEMRVGDMFPSFPRQKTERQSTNYFKGQGSVEFPPMTATLATENTPLQSIRSLWTCSPSINSLSLSRVASSSAAAQLLRSSRSGRAGGCQSL